MKFVRLINNSLLIKTENLYLKESSLAQTNEVEELELKSVLWCRNVVFRNSLQCWALVELDKAFWSIFGSEPKYPLLLNVIFTTFSYGCNLGPNQMARHSQGAVTSHMISYTNRRHISAAKLKLHWDIINFTTVLVYRLAGVQGKGCCWRQVWNIRK